MNPEERYYDRLLWTVSSIFLIAIGVLINVYFLESNTLSDSFRLFIAMGGLVLTLAVVWFAAGFREMRFKRRDKKEEVDKKFPQWGVYVIIFGLISAFWVYLIRNSSENIFPSGNFVPWLIILVFILGFFVYVYQMAKKPVECRESTTRK